MGDLINVLNCLQWEDIFVDIDMVLVLRVVGDCLVFDVPLRCMYLVGLLLFIPRINPG